jgi:hypothetical protein
MRDRSKQYQFEGWCIVMDLKGSYGTEGNRRVKDINAVVRYLALEEETEKGKHYRKGVEDGLKTVEVSRLDDLLTAEEVVRHLKKMPKKKR